MFRLLFLDPQCMCFNLHHSDLILHLQGLMWHYLVSQCLCLHFTLMDMQVASLTCVKSVWLTCKKV